MILNGLVISDVPDQYTSKGGQLIRTQLVTVVDQDKGGVRLKQSCDYVMSDDEKEKLAGQTQDKLIVLGISEISIFGGRPRVRGKIIQLDGKPVK